MFSRTPKRLACVQWSSAFLNIFAQLYPQSWNEKSSLKLRKISAEYFFIEQKLLDVETLQHSTALNRVLKIPEKQLKVQSRTTPENNSSPRREVLKFKIKVKR